MMPPLPIVPESIALLQRFDSLPHLVAGVGVGLAALGVVWLLAKRMRRVLGGLARGEPAQVLLAEGAEARGRMVGREVPVELVAVLIAAAAEALEPEAHIVSIVPAGPRDESGHQAAAWANEGRRQHFASHKVR